jgi:hypothetical protein
MKELPIMFFFKFKFTNKENPKLNTNIITKIVFQLIVFP